MSAGTAPPTLSVIVPVYNGGTDLATCLAALRASVLPPPDSYELIVVDDGSTDDSAARAGAAGARVLASPAPRSGPAAARNAGAAAARGAILLFIDADVAVPADLLARVAAAFREEPGLDALFGSYDARPAAPNFVSQYKNLFHHYVHQSSRGRASSFWAGCGAIRRAVFHACGGFDPTFDCPAVEDIELGYRLTRAGHLIRLRHDLQVTHLKRWTPRSLIWTDIRHRGIPWTRLLLRERARRPAPGAGTPDLADLNVRVADRVSVACVYLLALALLGALRMPALLGAALLPALALLALNAPLYRFFLRERGLGFLLASLPWHWLYYGYNGLSFGLGLLGHLRAGLVGDAGTAGEARARQPGEQGAAYAPGEGNAGARAE